MKDIKEALLELVSTEDVYMEQIVGEIHARPRCRNYSMASSSI